MRSLGCEVESYQERFAVFRDRRRALLFENVERFGFSPDAWCADCGDLGVLPDGDAMCTCDAGENVRIRRDRARLWDVVVPHRFRAYRLSTHPSREAVGQIESYLEGAPLRSGQNLFFAGPVGTGKTGGAVATLWEALIREGASIGFANVPELLDRARRTQGQGDVDPMVDLQRVAMLLLDDLGSERITEWAAERIFVLVNRRYERRYPTVVTTNRRLADLRSTLGERTMDRLTEDYSLVTMDGTSLRRR